MAETLRIGLVGAGAIGAVIARAVDDGSVAGELVGIADLDVPRAEALAASLTRPTPVSELAALAAAADVLVEAAGAGAVEAVVRAGLAAGADVLIMSVGALLAHEDLVAAAEAAGRRIYVPTGAIAALDAVRAARPAGLERVTLQTTKPPRGLAGAPGVAGLDLDALTEPTTVFEGSAREAVAAFPANVNVAAALSLAGIGADRTQVRVVAAPGRSVNEHRIEAEGAFGRLTVTVENVPSPDNPKTSYLAALSALALLRRLSATLVVGS